FVSGFAGNSVCDISFSGIAKEPLRLSLYSVIVSDVVYDKHLLLGGSVCGSLLGHSLSNVLLKECANQNCNLFGYLLSGLALYNLGRSFADHWEYTHFYTVRPEEKCSMQIIDRKHFEETVFPCFMMSSFMERSPERLLPDPDALDITSCLIDIRPFILHNETFLQVTREQECIIWHNVSITKEKNVIPCALLREYAETMKPSGIPNKIGR
ncbi:unnamed protein product, partial [Leptidea sinapis]